MVTRTCLNVTLNVQSVARLVFKTADDRHLMCSYASVRNIYVGVKKLIGDRGSTMVKVLCYKSEGRWFDPSLCH